MFQYYPNMQIQPYIPEMKREDVDPYYFCPRIPLGTPVYTPYYFNNTTYAGNLTSSDGEGSPRSPFEEEFLPNNTRRIQNNNFRNKQNKITTNINKRPRGKGKKNADCTYTKDNDRAKLFNSAFDNLRHRIPSIPSSKKLSKIEILRLAICYMSYLNFLLENPSQVEPTEKNQMESTDRSKEMITNDILEVSGSSIDQSLLEEV